MTRSASGRPLRFFAMMLAVWIAIRLLGPDITVPPPLPGPHHPSSSLVLTPITLLDASAMTAMRPIRTITMAVRDPDRLPPTHFVKATAIPRSGHNDGMPIQLMDFVASATDFTHAPQDHARNDGGIHAPTPSPPPLPARPPHTDRWRAGAWLLWRPDSGTANGAFPASQLGGSQAGVRLDYDISPHAASRVTAYGRLTRALQRPAAPEAALGLSMQPARTIPITLAAERRVALGTGGRDANAVMAVGGFGPKTIAPAILGEAYVQTGIVGFRRRDAFIDGKFSLTTPLDAVPIRLGAALSGGAQPGASRLDIGPEMQIRLPLPQANARLSVEWRHRIAGDARPGSGLAITLAADF